jgi:7-cyano-7-deazaguanine synthase
MKKNKKAVVLLSGGLDSSACLYWAVKKGYKCFGLVFNYGQKHKKEILNAKKIAAVAKTEIEIIKLNLPWLKTSSLIDKTKKIPNLPLPEIISGKIPSTYVAARNLMFVSIAASWADAILADAVIMGANALDYSGYPDCRPEFIKPLQNAINKGTRLKKLKILTPLINLTKAEIVKLAIKLRVPLELTWSCYGGGKKPCGKCDSCKLRQKGFKLAGIKDPLIK